MISEKILDFHKKRSSTGEIIVTLFEYCDLNCLFCNQDHNSFVGIDSIVDKFNDIKSSMNNLMLKGKKNFSIHIMGGEIFSDKIEDKYFEDYEILNRLLIDHSKETKIPIEINFVTNFVWNKKSRIKNFLKRNNVKLLTSYDPSGRFNSSNFEVYKDNIKEFKDYILSVNIIMTKPNIERFMKNQVPFFDYIYNNFNTYFDYYGPGKNSSFLTPTDIELRDFMRYMYDNWNNCYPFKNFSSKIKSQMSCMDTYTVMPDGEHGGCGYFENLQKVIPIKSVMEQKWFDNYNCLECEHLQRCSMGCFMSNHIKDMRTQEECWLKEVYDYIDLKNKD